MNAFRRIVGGWTAAVLVCLTLAQVALGQGISKPALVVSIAKADKLLADIGYLTRAAGVPEFGGLVTVMSGQYLEGLDTRRPAGVMLQFAGPQPTGLAFLGVNSMDKVIKQLENNGLEVQDAGGGIKKIELQRTIYFKESKGWLFIADSDANLSNLPANPAEKLGDLPDLYDLAIQVNARNIDPALVDMAISELRAGFERTLEGEDDPEKRAMQEKLGRQQMENLVRLIQESDQLTLGWGVDSNGGNTFIDFAMTAVPDTKLAKQMAGYKGLTSAFGGFDLPGSAASMRFTAPVQPEDMEQARQGLKTLREQAVKGIDQSDDLPSDEAKAALKQVTTTLMDVLLATLEGGKLDGGAALMLSPNSVQLVAGGLVADGAAIQAQLKKLADLAKETDNNDPRVEDLKFNAAKHKGVDFHTFAVPVPDDEEQAQELFGKKMSVVVGTGAKSAYLAFGNECSELLKRVLDNSQNSDDKSVMPMMLRISLTPILEFAASVQDDPIVGLLADSIKRSEGKDNIRITQKPIDRGVTARVEVEEGVLNLIGTAAKARNQLNN